MHSTPGWEIPGWEIFNGSEFAWTFIAEVSLIRHNRVCVKERPEFCASRHGFMFTAGPATI